MAQLGWAWLLPKRLPHGTEGLERPQCALYSFQAPRLLLLQCDISFCVLPHSPGCSRTYSVVQANLKLPVLLLQTPKCWKDRRALPCLAEKQNKHPFHKQKGDAGYGGAIS